MTSPLLICPNCQDKAPSRLLERRDQYDLYVCSLCDLTFSDPMQAASRDFYEANTEYDDKWEFNLMVNKCKQLELTGSLLDVGCGDGRFIKLMEKRFAVTGLDFNPSAVKIAKVGRGLSNVFPFTAEEFMATFPDKKFDVITSFHVLEHVEDPNRFIANIKQCLSPRGVVAVSVPNPCRWTLHWIREVWDYPPHHLTRWTIENIRHLLERNGFAILELCPETAGTWRQLKDGIRDIIWAIVFKRFSFGIAARLEACSEMNEVSKSLNYTRRFRVILRLILVNLKGTLIRFLTNLLALATFPIFRLRKHGGKSVFILARSLDAAVTENHK